MKHQEPFHPLICTVCLCVVRSAREAEDLEKKAMQKGETLPTEKRFDSNCITPGTVHIHSLLFVDLFDDCVIA